MTAGAAHKPRAIGRLLLATAIGLALCEGGVRFWLARFASADQIQKYGPIERSASTKTTPTAHEAHAYLGYVPRPGSDEGADQYNELGYRGRSFAIDKPAGQYRVACVGGDVITNHGIADFSKLYPYQLERLLNSEPGLPPIRVINAEVSGWSSYETLINYGLRLSEVNPDMIVVYLGVTDALARIVWPHEAYASDNSGYWGPAVARPCPPLAAASGFIRLLLVATGQMQSPGAINPEFGPRAATSMYEEYLAQADAGSYPSGVFAEHSLEEILSANSPGYFARNVENLVVVARADGRDVVLLTCKLSRAAAGALNHPAIHAAIDEQNEILRAIGQRLGVPVYEFAAAFPDDSQYFVDPAQFSEDGEMAQAELVAKFLVDDGFGERAKAAASSR